MRKIKLIVSLVVSVSAFVSCSSSKGYVTERTSGFQVAVYSDGKEVESTNQRLVHYFQVPAQVLSIVSREPNNGLNFAYSGETLKDSHGQIAGVKLKQKNDAYKLPTLGLRPEDVVRAVGKRPTKSEQDLRYLITLLESERSATLTLTRQGEPHKILYYLDSPEG